MDDETTEELTVECGDCAESVDGDTTTTVEDREVCEDCMSQYGSCEDCDDTTLQDDLVTVHKMDTYRWVERERKVCDSCADNYDECDSCSERHDNLGETLDGSNVCEGCRENMNYCDHCDGYYSDYDDTDHTHSGCDCEISESLSFRVKNGDDWLQNDTRLSLTLSAGTISEVGMSLIARAIRTEGEAVHAAVTTGLVAYTDPWYEARRTAQVEIDKWWNLSYRLDEIGPEWQGQRGNFTKRLSRFAHKEFGIKLSPALMANVGNIGREQSQGSDVQVETTRLLNLPAEAFYHADSCWWQSYSDSRCALKTTGGIGLRTFTDSGRVAGRAWAMPLRKVQKVVPMGDTWVDGPMVMSQDSYGGYPTYPQAGPKPIYGPERLLDTLEPTFDTETPDAWVIFNGYGDLQGYAGARIMAAMSGLTYRKCEFGADPMYVNAGGYIVADEETAQRIARDGLTLDIETHDSLWEREQRAGLAQAA